MKLITLQTDLKKVKVLTFGLWEYLFKKTVINLSIIQDRMIRSRTNRNQKKN